MGNLGKKSCEFTTAEANQSMAPWLFTLSKGGLHVPYNEFLDDMELFEAEFLLFHGFPFHGLRKNECQLIDRFRDRLIAKFGYAYLGSRIYKCSIILCEI